MTPGSLVSPGLRVVYTGWPSLDRGATSFIGPQPLELADHNRGGPSQVAEKTAVAGPGRALRPWGGV